MSTSTTERTNQGRRLGRTMAICGGLLGLIIVFSFAWAMGFNAGEDAKSLEVLSFVELVKEHQVLEQELREDWERFFFSLNNPSTQSQIFVMIYRAKQQRMMDLDNLLRTKVGLPPVTLPEPKKSPRSQEGMMEKPESDVRI
jgi:hypothetical protein